MSSANPPSTSFPLRLLVLLVSAPIQWVTALEWLWTRARIWPAARNEQAKVRSLGLRMEENRIGDQLIREKVTTLKGKVAEANLPRERKAEVLVDLDRQYYALGASALDATVPVLTTDKEYPNAQAARDRLRGVEHRAESLAARVWPTDALGWIGLIVSYAIVAWLVWLVVSSLTAATGPAAAAGPARLP